MLGVVLTLLVVVIGLAISSGSGHRAPNPNQIQAEQAADSIRAGQQYQEIQDLQRQEAAAEYQRIMNQPDAARDQVMRMQGYSGVNIRTSDGQQRTVYVAPTQ